MSMLKQFQTWLVDKPCQRLDEHQLSRKIKQAYQTTTSPTPPETLLAQIRLRAEKTAQLPPLEGSRAKTRQAQPVASSTPRRWRRAVNAVRTWWSDDQSPEERVMSNRHNKHREYYRLFMDYTLQQMHTSFVDMSMHLL